MRCKGGQGSGKEESVRKTEGWRSFIDRVIIRREGNDTELERQNVKKRGLIDRVIVRRERES